MHEGNLVNGRGWDNARAEGECIIRPRPLTRLPKCIKVHNALQTSIWFIEGHVSSTSDSSTYNNYVLLACLFWKWLYECSSFFLYQFHLKIEAFLHRMYEIQQCLLVCTLLLLWELPVFLWCLTVYIISVECAATAHVRRGGSGDGTKWLPSPSAASAETRLLCQLTAHVLRKKVCSIWILLRLSISLLACIGFVLLHQTDWSMLSFTRICAVSRLSSIYVTCAPITTWKLLSW